MKNKILALVLALAFVLAMAIPAAAATINQDSTPKTGSTALTYTVASAYTVTIPEAITVGADKTGTADVVVDAGALIAPGKRITVELTTCDFLLANDDSGTVTLAYDIKVGENTIEKDDTVLTHAAGTTAETRAALAVEVTGIPTYSGVYKDTVTFTVAVGNPIG